MANMLCSSKHDGVTLTCNVNDGPAAASSSAASIIDTSVSWRMQSGLTCHLTCYCLMSCVLNFKLSMPVYHDFLHFFSSATDLITLSKKSLMSYFNVVQGMAIILTRRAGVSISCHQHFLVSICM